MGRGSSPPPPGLGSGPGGSGDSSDPSQPEMRSGTSRGDLVYRWVLRGISWSIIALFIGLIILLLQMSWEAWSHYGLGFVFTNQWNPPLEEFGAAPFLVGTLVTSLLAVLLAAPISVGTALFLKEVAPTRISAVLAFLVELLAAIPSVVYGLWGVFVLAPLMREDVQPLLSRWLGPETFFANALGHLFTGLAYPLVLIGSQFGWTNVSLSILSENMQRLSQGLMDGPPMGLGLLTASLVLSIMIMPTITALSREVLATVPDSIREAALGLGATRWEMMKLALLKTGRAGLVGAVLLGVGRAMGETMAVTMVIGNRNEIPTSFMHPAQTMASVLANEYGEASGLHLSSLAAVGLTLLMVSLIINLLARGIIRYLEKKA
jgi:phosphate transport system permease protein